MNSKLNRNYTDWTYIGSLTGWFDFKQSDKRFQEMFSNGSYYAKYDVNSDFWFFTKESRGDERYPHYSLKYTGVSSETTDEHFTYSRRKSIRVVNLPWFGAGSRFNSLLEKLVADYPEVENYYV